MAGSLASSLWLDVRSLLAFRASGDVEGDALVFLQRFETVGIDGREMRKDVFATAVRGDEAETFSIVEPFYSASCHVNSLKKLLCVYAPCWRYLDRNQGHALHCKSDYKDKFLKRKQDFSIVFVFTTSYLDRMFVRGLDIDQNVIGTRKVRVTSGVSRVTPAPTAMFSVRFGLRR